MIRVILVNFKDGKIEEQAYFLHHPLRLAASVGIA